MRGGNSALVTGPRCQNSIDAPNRHIIVREGYYCAQAQLPMLLFVRHLDRATTGRLRNHFFAISFLPSCHFGAKVQNCHKPFVDGSTTRHAAKVLIAPAYYTIGNRAGHQNSGPAKLFENF